MTFMFKLSSNSIFLRIQGAFRHFPLVLASSFYLSCTGIALTHSSRVITEPRLAVTIMFGLPFLIAAAFFQERSQNKYAAYTMHLAAILVMFAFYLFYLPFLFSAPMATYSDSYLLQVLLWWGSGVLIASVLPFVFSKNRESAIEWWYFNKKIIYTFITTAVYAAVLFIGIALAVGSVQFLFDAGISEQVYSNIWLIIVGILAPVFFFARMARIGGESEPQSYPKEIRTLASYVLVPLVTVYFVILYAYTGKIIITEIWPKGGVALLVLGFSAVGLITYILLYPVIREKKNLLPAFSKGFFIALIPQIAVLFIAVWFRMSAYGVTPERYLLAALGVWFLGISIYHLASKAKDIRVIPGTLAALLIIISVGPWGMFSVSLSSQVHRFEAIVTKDNALENGHVVMAGAAFSDEDKQELSSIVDYLSSMHKLGSIQYLFTQNILSCGMDEKNTCASDTEPVRTILGLGSVTPPDSDE